MSFPKLTQLQSRFAVSLGATALLILIYLSINKPSFAYATELDTRIPPDHNHPIVEPWHIVNDGCSSASDTADDGGENCMTEIAKDFKTEPVEPLEPRVGMRYEDDMNCIANSRRSCNQWSGTAMMGEQRDGQEHGGSDLGGCLVAQSASDFGKRALDGVSALSNNAPQNQNLLPGQTENWVFTMEQIQGPHGEQGSGFPSDVDVTRNMTTNGPFSRALRTRQSSTPVWITINTCLQPVSNTSLEDTPPQLQLFYSTSSDIQKPGATEAGPAGTQVDVLGGYAMIQLNATSDVYIGVTAPNITSFTGPWNYEIAASNDAPFHSWSNATDLLFVDGDNHAALLVTPDFIDAPKNSTVFEAWMSMKAPYGMFAHSQKDKSILGLSRSYCGLFNNAKISANIVGVSGNNVGTMTSRGLGGNPKEQFYIQALNTSSSYWGFLAMSGNSTHKGAGVIGGGGSVWTNMSFNTKASDNCALMYNLSFCSEVAYAVPANPAKYSPLTGLSNLSQVYDSYASQMYQNFNYSLQQIPCNTTATAQYSLARNCDDCARAYKQWLCAVTIPRCEDWTNDAPYLSPRNMAQNFPNGSAPSWVSNPDTNQQVLLTAVQSNSSRNSHIIDDIIQPGPYKEVLPCIDLCYDLVQSCPAALGFGCPQGKYQNLSYGVRDPNPGILSCSYPGAAYYLSAGPKAVQVPGLDRIAWTALTVTLMALVL